MPHVHPTAIVDPKAELGEYVEVGPYSVIEAGVTVGAGCQVGPFCRFQGPTTIGTGNRFMSHCSIGVQPQDLKFKGDPTRLEIGDNNTIREYCTLNLGTAQDIGITRVGDNNWIMAYAHVAHDCQVGSNVVLANASQLAGHVQLGDYVILGGGTLVHQFCRIGAHAFTAGGSVVLRDVPPYVMAGGNSARPHGINSEGLKRRGFSSEAIESIRRAYKTLYRLKLSFEEAKATIAEQARTVDQIKILSEFLASTERGVIR